MEMYVDEKWRLSKKGSRGGGGGSSGGGVGAEGRRRAKMTTQQRSFAGRCAALAKEQRARFYIVRRCVTMLICWRDYP